VVESGEIEVLAELADGGSELRAVIPAGEYFGEFGPLFGMPRSATARARVPSVVTAYSTRDFRQRVQTAEALVTPAAKPARARKRVAATR
jgi:putative ABC transport system ATP-binding protein